MGEDGRPLKSKFWHNEIDETKSIEFIGPNLPLQRVYTFAKSSGPKVGPAPFLKQKPTTTIHRSQDCQQYALSKVSPPEPVNEIPTTQYLGEVANDTCEVAFQSHDPSSTRRRV